MRINIIEYLKSIQETNPIVSIVLGTITYILFPEQAYLTAFCSVLGVMVLDVLTKYYSIATNHGGFWKSLKYKHINSNSMWVGTSRKIFTYLMIFIMVGLSYRVSPIAGVASFLGTIVYSLLFLRECQSILENLEDAGADVGWLTAIVKKRKKKILEEEGVDEDELDNK
jgi:phage-related holin